MFRAVAQRWVISVFPVSCLLGEQSGNGKKARGMSRARCQWIGLINRVDSKVATIKGLVFQYFARVW